MILPQLVAQFPQMIAIMQTMRTMMLTMHSTMSGIFDAMDESSQDATAMGQAFDAAKTTIPSICRRRFSRTRTSSAR